MKDKITFLVNSCDKYEDLWYPFFKLFDKFGGELKDCDIVLNTETKSFQYPGLNIICPKLYSAGEIVPWGKRLKDTLNTIKTKYVFAVLDDFFVRRPVEVDVFKKCIGYLDANDAVGAFNFEMLDGVVEESGSYHDFCKIAENTKYRFNAQACLWKKEILFNSLLEFESPWDWEMHGNIRNSILLKDTEIYALKPGAREPYFYDFYRFGEYSSDKRTINCSPVMRGKWVVGSVDNLFKENDIEIDYSIRGVFKPVKEKKFKKTLLYKFLFFIAKPFRRKTLTASKLEAEIKNKENMDKFVNPYIKNNE